MAYPFIVIGGQPRYMALKPRTIAAGECGKLYGVGDAPPVLPRSEWKDGAGVPDSFVRLVDQDGLNYCHSYAGVTAVEASYRLLDSESPVKLSGTGLGSLVTGGQNDGAGIDQVLKTILAKGIPLEDDVPEGDYRRRDWQPGWEARALENAVIELYDCGYDGIFDKISSGLHGPYLGVFGCSRPYGPHAMCATRLVKMAKGWAWRIAQTWGDGYHVLEESKIGGIDQYGGWLVRVVRPHGSPLPPAPKA